VVLEAGTAALRWVVVRTGDLNSSINTRTLSVSAEPTSKELDSILQFPIHGRGAKCGSWACLSGDVIEGEEEVKERGCAQEVS
jgi:hypothetical protein